MAIENVYKIDYLKETLYLHHDKRFFSSCAQCKLTRPSCGDVCLLGGTRKHVGAIQRHSWLKIIARWWRYRRTGKYAK